MNEADLEQQTPDTEHHSVASSAADMDIQGSNEPADEGDVAMQSNTNSLRPSVPTVSTLTYVLEDENRRGGIDHLLLDHSTIFFF